MPQFEGPLSDGLLSWMMSATDKQHQLAAACSSASAPTLMPYLRRCNRRAVGAQHHKLEQRALVLVAAVVRAKDAEQRGAVGVAQRRQALVGPGAQRLGVRADGLWSGGAGQA